jgi:hypothetical protein
MAGLYGGLQPWNKVIRARKYRITAAYATSLFKGDPVARHTDGSIIIATAAATNVQLGAIIATFDVNYNPTNFYLGSAGSLGGFALVADHQDQEYVIAEDADTSQLAIANEGENGILVATNTGDTQTGLAGWMLDSNTVTTGATLTYQVVCLAPIVGNEVYHATRCPYPKWIVRNNLYQFANAAVGI